MGGASSMRGASMRGVVDAGNQSPHPAGPFAGRLHKAIGQPFTPGLSLQAFKSTALKSQDVEPLSEDHVHGDPLLL